MIREKIMFEEMTEQQAREEILKLTKGAKWLAFANGPGNI